MTATAELPLTFPAQLRKVQSGGEDFEWYPTTDEIIHALNVQHGKLKGCLRHALMRVSREVREKAQEHAEAIWEIINPQQRELALS